MTTIYTIETDAPHHQALPEFTSRMAARQWVGRQLDILRTLALAAGNRTITLHSGLSATAWGLRVVAPDAPEQPLGEVSYYVVEGGRSHRDITCHYLATRHACRWEAAKRALNRLPAKRIRQMCAEAGIAYPRWKEVAVCRVLGAMPLSKRQAFLPAGFQDLTVREFYTQFTGRDWGVQA